MVSRVKKIWQHKKGKWAIFGAVIVLLFMLPVRCEGPYRGRVVTQENGKPLSGVVVVGSWTYIIPNVGGGTTRCVDADEVLTDENGEFEISGRWIPPLRPRGSMDIHIYKVGYRGVECSWEYLTREGSCYANKPVEFDGGRAVFPFEKMSMDELNWQGSPPSVGCGRKDGKPLTAWRSEREKYYEALEKKH